MFWSPVHLPSYIAGEAVFPDRSLGSRIGSDAPVGPEHLEKAIAFPIRDLEDPIFYYNSGNFALSSRIVTKDLSQVMKACKELKTGTTKDDEVPGYRLELTPFGGTRDSGLRVKGE